MEKQEHPDQLIMSLKKKVPRVDIGRDTIGASPGAGFIGMPDLKEYVEIVGLKNAKSMIKSGQWRITEKGRAYLQRL